jgi:hypothetical protein
MVVICRCVCVCVYIYIYIRRIDLKYAAQCIILYTGRKEILVWMEQARLWKFKKDNGKTFLKTCYRPVVDMHFMHGYQSRVKYSFKTIKQTIEKINRLQRITVLIH